MQSRRGSDGISGSEWRWVVGYEGKYLVSDSGQVARIMKPMIRTTRSSKHVHVDLTRSPGQVQRLWIHRLVLEAFVGPCPPGMETCHANGDGLENNVENLRWDTHGENQRDPLRRRNPTMAILSKNQREKVRRAVGRIMGAPVGQEGVGPVRSGVDITDRFRLPAELVKGSK